MPTTRAARITCASTSLPDSGAPTVLTVNSLLDNVTPGDGLVTLPKRSWLPTILTTDLGQTGTNTDVIEFDRVFSPRASRHPPDLRQ